MKNYNNFIYEAYDRFTFSKITDKLSTEQFNEELLKCDSVSDNVYHKIYRSVDLYDPYYLIKNSTPGFERISAYAPNHYTLFINHSPLWEDYPKRNFICSYNRQAGFGDTIYVVIPYKNSKWGICPTNDIQNIQNLYRTMLKLDAAKVDDSSYENMLNTLDKTDYSDNPYTIEDLNVLFDPDNNGFVLSDYKDLDKNIKTPRPEIWTDSDVLLIRIDEFEKRFKYYENL